MSVTTEEEVFEVVLPERELTKFERERQAFYKFLPDLLQTHRDQYVAIHEEQIVGTGPNRLELAKQVWESVGNVPIYVGLVSVEPRTLRMPTLRLEH